MPPSAVPTALPQQVTASPQQIQTASLGQIPTAMGPLRTCVSCRRTYAKPRLVRLVRVRDRIEVDASATMPGRGCYVCDDPECITTALQRDAKRIRKALRLSSGRATVDGESLRDAWQRAVAPPSRSENEVKMQN